MDLGKAHFLSNCPCAQVATKLVMAADHRENQRRRKGPSWGFRVQDGDLGSFFGVYRFQVGDLGSKLEVSEAFLGCIFGLVGCQWGVGEAQRQLGRGLEGLGLSSEAQAGQSAAVLRLS